MYINQKSSTVILLIAIVGHFFVDMMIGVWAIFKTVAHLDLALAGIISALSAFIGEGAQFLFGHLSDRGHSKKLLIVGLLASGSAAFLAYTHTYFSFFILFLLTCLGSGAFHPTAASMMSQFKVKRKSLMIALFSAGGTLGMAFSQLLFTGVCGFCNGHTLLLMLPLLFLIPLLLLFPLPEAAPTFAKHSIKDTFKLFQRKELKILYFSQICTQSVIWAFLFFLPDLLLAREYDTWIALGGGHMIALIGATCMLVPSGYLADRFSCKIVLLISTGLSLFLLYAILFFPFLSNGTLFTLLFFLGATLNTSNPLAIAFGNQLAPEHPGKVSALLMGMVWCISEGVGQGIGGLLTKLFTEDAAARSLAMLSTLQIVAFILFLKLPLIKTVHSPSREVADEIPA